MTDDGETEDEIGDETEGRVDDETGTEPEDRGDDETADGVAGEGLRPLRAECYHAVAPPFDLGGHLRRLRRRFDLSQRELAAHLGVSQSTVARWETGERRMSLGQFDAVCALVGWRLVIVDADGEPVRPMEAQGLARDAAHRLFPAHLDVWINDPDAIPWRPDLTIPPAGAPRRDHRDAIRAETGVVEPHPSAEEVELRVWLRRAAARERRDRRWAERRKLLRFEPVELCICALACEESRVCVPECPCQCVTAA